MKGSLFPIALAVVGGIIYHVSQKSVPQGFNPLRAVVIAYAVGIGLCLALMAFFSIRYGEREAFTAPWQWSWSVFGIGFGAVMIEVSFLLIYRAGLDLSVASVGVTIGVALALLPIGVFLHGERLTLRTAAGILCCLCGLLLLVRR